MDYYTKLFKYRTAKVREYWIVDSDKSRITVYNFQSEDTHEFTFFQSVRAAAVSQKGTTFMEIIKLDPAKYTGRKFTIRYTTGGYYDIRPDASGFRIEYRQFENTLEKSFDDVFFSKWLEAPTGYGAFENGRMIGYVEGSPETWNNRYRISNIFVSDESRRRCGIGTALMNTILNEAAESGARMTILETQSCNEKAIAFYRKNGFEIIGFDLYSYSNHDPERHEVRIEMGRGSDF